MYAKVCLLLFRLNKLNRYFPCNPMTSQGFYFQYSVLGEKKKRNFSQDP